MIKKKLNILLLLLLVALFTSLLGTTSYARELTVNDLKNFICNFAEEYYQSMSTEQIRNNLDNQTENLETWVFYANRYEGQYFLYGGGNGYTVSLVCYNASNDNLNSHFPYYYFSYDTAYLAFNNSYLNAWRWTYHINSNTFDNYVSGSSNLISIYSNINQSNLKFFLYTDMNVRNGANQADIVNGNNKYVAGEFVPNRDLFSGFYTDDYFVFTLNQNLDSIDIDGDPVPLIDFQNNSANQVVLGYLDLAENFDYAELFTYRWYQNKWKLINIKRVDDVGTLQNDFINVILKGDDYLGDTLYSYQFNSVPDKDFENYSQPFYIKTKYTVITNGSLDIANTFSGDYYTNYNNDTNTQNVIGTLTDDEQEQQSLNELDNLFSGDINQLAEQFGYVDLADPVLGIFPSNIYNRLVEYMNDLTDVLLEEEPQTFTFYLHDQTGQVVLNTNDFITPNGPLKVFMQLFLITCTIFVVWHQFYRYYELLSTFNVVLLMHDLDVEKTVFRM